MGGSIDDDLKEAIEERHDAPEDAPSARQRPRTASRPKRNLGLLAALAGVAVLVGALLFASFEGVAVYAKTVDQLVDSRDKLVGRAVRVEGMLVHGSLVKRDQPCEYRFKLAKNGATIDVRYPQCVVPDTFRDRPDAQVGVTVEGKLVADGSFEATQIMAKCPSKYEEQAGSKAPVGMGEPSR